MNLNNKSNNGTMIKKNNKMIVNKDEILEAWRKHFENLAIKSESVDLVDFENNNLDCSEVNESIKWSEIIEVLKKLKNNKAVGTDLIPTEVYKSVEMDMEMKCSLSKYMLKLFNCMFDKAIIPLCWKTSIIVPIHKKGDATDMNNYRGISLINTCLKLFLKIITDRITRIVEDKNILVKEQVGF